jgi:hypothetical protein
VLLVWPTLVVIAGVVAWMRRDEPGGRGRRWFLAWAVAGFLMSFSFVTGFSIGLFLLPLAAFALIWAARRSPHLREATGFLLGIVPTAALLAVASGY